MSRFGESENNATYLQERFDNDSQQYDVGQFMLPITTNGTISAINASGYCLTANMTQKTFSLLYLVYQKDKKNQRGENHFLPAVCNTSVGEDVVIGTVQKTIKDGIKVKDGDYLAVRFGNCLKERCNFRPATRPESGDQEYWYTGSGAGNLSNIMESAIRVQGLHFSFDVAKDGKLLLSNPKLLMVIMMNQ